MITASGGAMKRLTRMIIVPGQKGKTMRLIDADALEPYYRLMQDNATGMKMMALPDGIVDQQPTVEATPARHGKWIYGNEFHWYTASCNHCGYKRYTDIKAAKWNAWKYCPNCGARMETE